MPMFGFDEQYAYYGVTPVDNQFILEYLPNAAGDAVRVYLYGLMQCYHPQQAMTLAQMAKELSMNEDAVLTAYRHWERKGLVRRVADNPPAFRYVSIKQLTMTGSAMPVDEEYETFAAAVYGLFGNDRRIHGAEMSHIYEWVEELHLPADVVLYLIREMIEQHGKNVAVKTIEKRATMLAEEAVSSVEEAQTVLTRDKAVWDGSRAVLRRFGKRRNPSEDEQAMYRTWYVDWGFSAEDILAACAETTKGEPNFAYLGGILSRLRAQKKVKGVEAALQQEKDEAAPLKALLKAMGDRDTTVNETTLQDYANMRALYPDAIILMAGRECAKRGAKYKDVAQTLKNWKRNNLETAEDVTRYMQQIDAMNETVEVIYEAIGIKTKPNATDRKRIQKWTQQFGYELAFVIQCAAFAADTGKPMAYLDAMLENFHQKNIRTLEEAQQERERFRQEYAAKSGKAEAAPRGPKTVEQQNYTQREYTHTDDAMDDLMKDWKENADA